MSTSAPEATTDYITRSGPSRRPRRPSAGVRSALAGLPILAAFLLILSTFLPLLEVSTGDSVLDSRTGLEHHSIAMVLLGLAVVPMALGARRGARPAMAALVLLGIVVLVVVVTVDLPATLDEGIYGERYEGAAAQPGPGFFAETLAGVLLLLAGGLGLLGLGRADADGDAEQETGSASAPAVAKGRSRRSRPSRLPRRPADD